MIQEYEKVHQNKTYGVSGNKFIPQIQALLAELRPQTILNYGSGQTRLEQKMNLFGAEFFNYDPAIEEISRIPLSRCDLLINTDVLEHVPEEELERVLVEISSLSSRVFFNISTRPAKEILPNGRNAHCTLKSAREWKMILQRHFPDVELAFERPGHSCIFLTWKSCMKDAVAAISERNIARKNIMKYLFFRLRAALTLAG